MTETTQPAGQPATGDLATGKETAMPGGQDNQALTTEGLEDQLRKILQGETETAQPPGKESPPAGEGAATEPESDTEHEEPPETRAQWPESAQKRVDKLTAQKSELKESLTALQSEKGALEERLADMETRLQEAENQGAAAPIPGDPLAFITTPKDLGQYVNTVKTQKRNIEDFLDGALPEDRMKGFTEWAKGNDAVDAEGQFNTAKLKQLKRLMDDTLTEHVPHRMDYFKDEARHSAIAAEKFPWLADTKSEEYKVFKSVVAQVPEIRRFPHWKSIGAIFVLGLQQMKASAAKGNGNGKPKAAPQTRLPGAPAVLPQRTTDAASTLQALRQKAFAPGATAKDMEAFTKAQLEASLS